MNEENNINNPLWVEKYRPQTVQETILPKELKIIFQQFVDKESVPNIICAGSSGCGKTTVSKAMLRQLGCDILIINGSLDAGIDTLRNKISDFASSMSFAGGRKYVILDEADYISQPVQNALRNFMEEFSENCGFILTCNYKNRIIDALKSRCSVIDFSFTKKDKETMAIGFFKRSCEILRIENINFDKKAVAELVKKYFPDFRRVLNELQKYSMTGKIDSGVMINFTNDNFQKLLNFLKDKDYTSVRKWVAENQDIEPTVVFRQFYDISEEFMTKESKPAICTIINEFYKSSMLAVDQEINLSAFFVEIMCSEFIEFK